MHNARRIVQKAPTCSNTQGRREADKAYAFKRKHNEDLARAQAIRNTSDYRTFIAWMRRLQPLCEMCLMDEKTVPSEQIHHIRGLSAHPEDAFDYAECLAMCTHCHSRIENMDKQAAQAACIEAQKLRT